ncbi:MAG: hypothetical protein KAU20_02685 [Nanoarchaeota archaeon]|nr:hypothetical protein [Nanoarchaeota archaeon]
MKHTPKIIFVLVLFFFISQVTGLFITSKYIDIKETVSVDPLTNETTISKNITYGELPLNIERPVIEPKTSFTYIILAIIVATILALLLMRLKKVILWKTWFFFAVFMCLTISFSAFIPQLIAAPIAFMLALWRIIRPAFIIHNITEIFIYGGIAAILVPIMNIFSIIMLLLLISLYDMYAVWKSKHMIKMAKFQAKAKVFAGLLIPYKKEKGERKKKIKKQGKVVFKGVKTAILGGGDIAFPLLFAGVVMKTLMLENIFIIAFLKTLIIPFVTAIALLLLFVKGKENKFYPAMPFLTIGCLVGYGILLLINVFV